MRDLVQHLHDLCDPLPFQTSGLDIPTWQTLKTRRPSLLPAGTKIAHKTGTGARGFMDAGVVFTDERPLFILTAYTDRVPAALPDGTPGVAGAAQLIGLMARTCWDALETGS